MYSLVVVSRICEQVDLLLTDLALTAAAKIGSKIGSAWLGRS